ncbi:MAG: hypothetical protein ACYDAS_02440 [Patescibacteria group bacterium]
MGDKILKNSYTISFIIEFILFLTIGIFFIIVIINTVFPYVKNIHLYHSQSSISLNSTRKTVTIKQKKINKNIEESFVQKFYTILSTSNGLNDNLGSYITQSFQNTMIAQYQNSNYAKDIKQSLGIPGFPSSIHFYQSFAGYFVVYGNYNGSIEYFNIYLQKINGKYFVNNITLSSG